MPTREALSVFLRSIEQKSYYAILRVPEDAPPGDIKAAFHDFSLLYHPDRYVDWPVEIGEVATAIFKRGVEAYRCLSRPEARARYDNAQARGAVGTVRADGPVPKAPDPPPIRTLETIANNAHAKQYARKADRLLTIGHLDEARVQLVSACQADPYNEELSERLALLYEALALDPS
jgi:curved DNA-binding protein CbpA